MTLPMPEPKRTYDCYSCSHSLTCFMRIELTRTIQSFKLLAESSKEIKNTKCTTQVADIFRAVAQSCSVYEES